MRISKETNEKVEALPKLPMSINKNRQTTIWRSSTPIDFNHNGATIQSDCYIELVQFSYDIDLSEYFLKYPGSDTYIELITGGTSSGGGKTSASVRNAVDEYVDPFVIDGLLVKRDLIFYTAGDEGLLRDSIDHWFFKKVAYQNDPKHTYTNSPVDFGQRYINAMLNSQYAGLPNRREISYCYETENGRLILVDHSATKYTYKGMRCWYGLRGSMKEVKIENFGRYRDGGTTHFEFEADGETHKFFVPTRLGQNREGAKKATFDEKEMVELGQPTAREIALDLGINLQPLLYKD